MTVTFFGHAKFTFHREQYLQTVLENLIVNEGASVVVTYVICPGGASKYMELAKKKGKRIINLGE